MQTAELKGFDTDAARILAAQNLSDRQISFIYNYLQGMPKHDAAVAAGYETTSASTVFRGAKVQAALALVMDRFLLGELAPMALRTAHQIMGDPKSPAGVRGADSSGDQVEKILIGVESSRERSSSIWAWSLSS